MEAVKMIPLDTMTADERNTWFAGLSDKEQRLHLAQDVLDQLADGKLRAKSGVYFHLSAANVRKLKKLSVQEALEQAPTCQVCALGALFVSRVAGYNQFRTGTLLEEWADLTSGPLTWRGPIVSPLSMFSSEQISLIECAFECGDEFGNASPWKRMQATRLYEHLRSPRARLRAIMQNIIRNGGNFVLKDE
jgi:hypothetical protein